jgi:glycosyltransferase involved in cell wall biosynthesis
MKFSLIIPCFNESKNIPLLLERCSSLVDSSNDIEIILVDNGSTDETPEVLAKSLMSYPMCRSVRVDVNQGYGHGILAGLHAADGDILGWTHADMQTDPTDALEGLKYFDELGLDVFCKGKRFGRPLFDELFTVGMSVFESLLLRKAMWDINAQPTMFSKEFFRTWECPPNDFSLDLYAYYMAKKSNLEIRRFRVRFSERAFGVSHWNADFSAKLKFIRRTITFSLNLKRGLKR